MLLRSADVPKRANQHDEKPEEGARQWYIMGKVVGTGTFGRVHAARHRVSDDRVAIKSYFRDKGALVCCPAPSCIPKKPSHLTDPLEWKRVRREATLMATLPVHPGLVQLVEVFETPTQLQLVMECVDGGSLYDLLKRQPHQKLTEAHAKRLFAQLCAALAALHAQNIIHRDLKLENILLDEHARPRIIDFGFSQIESTRSDGRDAVASAVKNFCGTPSYMAPEVVSCKRYDGKRVDVWSLGVLLYVLLCGKFPFQGQSIHQLYQNIRATSLAFPSSLSKDVQHLLQGILVVDPAQRFTLSEIQDHSWLHTMFQSEILAQEHAFTALMAWQEAHDVLRTALDLPKDETNDTKGSKPRKGGSALVFLLLLRVEKQFFAQFVKKTASTQSIQLPTAPVTSITHKQQLEQLIGLVRSSLR
ncbi:hypothetical protein Poli38472_005423 [Pythium oligandrum]|uniref:Protein kinase domain-containing protein n=1 Tax=Pythium oligandrum TaxID=41045 RepID=A0A8K1FGI5_PYTOL|nr:hypothetical protein Poli38472_005423 [Pythium oligandrum]|eukprot:TMW62805.1 hypothetical protein Poli38472_005423 [Pythium oligandrum]